MNVIVLGGGVVGVTTAYYMLKHGHEVTQVERQPGVARECSHTNGGFVAISQAVTWSAGHADQDLQDHGAADAPILIHPSQLRRRDRNPQGALRRSSVRRCGRHEQPPNHGAPPTLVVAIAATSLEPDGRRGPQNSMGVGSRWLWRMR